MINSNFFQKTDAYNRLREKKIVFFSVVPFWHEIIDAFNDIGMEVVTWIEK